MPEPDRPAAAPASAGSAAEPAGLAARKKERTRRQLAEAARALFAEQGYARTTVEEICRAADISPRTFFRYYPTKEDLVTDLGQRSMDELVAAIEARPAGEAPLPALRAAITETFTEPWRDTAAVREFIELLDQAPRLRARWLEESRHYQQQLAAVLAPRLGAAADDLGALLAAGAVAVVIDTALQRWAASGALGDDLVALVTGALEELTRPLLPPGDREGT